MKRNGHKFNAQRTEIDGIAFASKAESRRYAELKLLEKAGKISDLRLQPVFPLCVVLSTGTVRGGLQALSGAYPAIGKYVADFQYYRNEAPIGWVTEDVKGMKTALYRWKKKHVEAQYGITITEITRR